MNFNVIWLKIKDLFRELWKYRIFQIAFILHLIYFFLSNFLTLNFLRYRTDFRVYFMAGDAFLNNINNLYSLSFTCPFRYLPISAALFVPFYLMGFDLGFIIFNLSNLIMNIFICFLLYKIAILVKKENCEKIDKNTLYYICIYLMGIPHIYNYILGQINLYVTFLLLISLYFFLTRENLKWNLISSII